MPHFKRSTLLVSDLEKSLSLYRDVLNFKVHKINDSEADSYSYPVFKIPKGAKIKFCTLDSDDQVRALALTEVKGVKLPNPTEPIMSCCVIKVDNLEETLKKIKTLQLEHTKIEMDKSSDGYQFKESSFIDFDGHLIVIYDFS